MKKLFSSDSVFPISFTLPLIIIVLFFVCIIIAVVSSTHSELLLSTFLDKEILFAIKLSLISATAATLISLIISVPASYILSRYNFAGRTIVDTILDLPVVISPIALGACLLIFFSSPIGKTIDKAVSGIVFSFKGIILAQFTVITGLAIRLLKSTFEGIDPRYEHIARTLGYGRFRTFFRVTIPMAKSGIIASIILTWSRAVGEFGATVTLAGATAMKTETLPVAIFLNLASADVKKAIAVIIILIAIALLSLIIIRKTAHRVF